MTLLSFFLSAITSTTISAIIKSTNAIFLHTPIAHTLRFINCGNITKRTYFRHMCNSMEIKNKSLSEIDIFFFYQCLEFISESGSYLSAVQVKFVYRSCLVTDIVPVFRIDVYNRKIFLFLF